MCIDLVMARTWLRSLNTAPKCGTILLCHISPFRISHLPNPPPPPLHRLLGATPHPLPPFWPPAPHAPRAMRRQLQSSGRKPDCLHLICGLSCTQSFALSPGLWSWRGMWRGVWASASASAQRTGNSGIGREGLSAEAANKTRTPPAPDFRGAPSTEALWTFQKSSGADTTSGTPHPPRPPLAMGLFGGGGHHCHTERGDGDCGDVQRVSHVSLGQGGQRAPRHALEELGVVWTRGGGGV